MSRAMPLGWRLRALVGAMVIPPLLSVVSFARLSAWLGRTGAASPSPKFDPAAVAGWVDRLLYAWPRPWRHTCLKRSAVLYHVFRRAGLPVELCIGVRRDELGALAAHAWLLREGQPYLERSAIPAGTHTIIARFPEG